MSVLQSCKWKLDWVELCSVLPLGNSEQHRFIFLLSKSLKKSAESPQGFCKELPTEGPSDNNTILQKLRPPGKCDYPHDRPSDFTRFGPLCRHDKTVKQRFQQQQNIIPPTPPLQAQYADSVDLKGELMNNRACPVKFLEV